MMEGCWRRSPPTFEALTDKQQWQGTENLEAVGYDKTNYVIFNIFPARVYLLDSVMIWVQGGH